MTQQVQVQVPEYTLNRAGYVSADRVKAAAIQLVNTSRGGYPPAEVLAIVDKAVKAAGRKA